MKKNENIIVIRPVKIFLDELEEIFTVLSTKYKEEELSIETDNYIYNNFEELSRSPEDIVYRLKIATKDDKRLKINFKDNIYIESDDKNNLGLITKIKNILSYKRLLKASFPYYFVRYNKIWFNIIITIIPIIILIFFRNPQNYLIFIFFISYLLYIVFYRLFLSRNSDKILYSTIILYKKNIFLDKDLKFEEKNYSKALLTVGIIGLFVPFILLLINFLITKYFGK